MATNSEILAFMELFGRLAVTECNNRIAAGKGFILPSVAMAQSALESDWGQAGLMKKANAFFGVKAGGSWTGKVYSASTWEVVEGEVHNITANFRAYNSPAESMADYYELTCSLTRYANGVSYGTDRTKWKTAKETVTALWKGGYATDELYVNKIMNTINGRDLTYYDTLITGEGDISGGGTTTPTVARSYDFKDSDFIGGTYTYYQNKWTHATLSIGLTTNVETVESSGMYVFSGIPEGATMNVLHKSASGYVGVPITENESRYFEEGDEFVITLTFDSSDAASSASFTLTMASASAINENKVLAYFVKIE